MDRDDLRERAARAICIERCAAVGDPPCYSLDGYDGTDCGLVGGAGCRVLADAALAIVREHLLSDEAVERAAIVEMTMRTPLALKYKRDAIRAALGDE